MMAILWQIDPVHSEIRFKVKHLMISTVAGSFNRFHGNIVTYDEAFTRGKSASFTAETNSIFTNHPERDEHLKSMDFFDVGLYPKISFTAHRFHMEDGEIQGDLTIKGTTKKIVLQTTFGGISQEGEGKWRAGFSAAGKINRKEFGLSWDDVTNVGNVIVSDQVVLSAELELIRVT